MPERDVHLIFDLILKVLGIISRETETESVHKRIDRGVKKFGPHHREEDYYHSEEGIRDWLNNFPENVYQDTLTDLLRAGLAHLILDKVEEENPDFTLEELIFEALDLYIELGYDRTFFKPMRR